MGTILNELSLYNLLVKKEVMKKLGRTDYYYRS